MPAVGGTGRWARRDCLAAWPFLLGWPLHARAAAGPLRRVVVLDWSLVETMLALGAVPLAVGEASNYRTWLPEPVLPAGVVDLGLLTEPNLELLVQLAPDLILLGNGQEAAIGPTLERIAPVRSMSIYTGEAQPLARARTVALELARLLGRGAAGDALIARADQTMAVARARLTLSHRERPVLLFLFSDDRHGWIADGNGLLQGIMNELGLANAWRGTASFWGYSVVGIDALASAPEAGIVYADFGLADPAPALRSPIWHALPAVRAGRTASIPRFWYFGGLPTAMRLAEQLADSVVSMPLG